jgi:hypothetical protein
MWISKGKLEELMKSEYDRGYSAGVGKAVMNRMTGKETEPMNVTDAIAPAVGLATLALLRKIGLKRLLML